MCVYCKEAPACDHERDSCARAGASIAPSAVTAPRHSLHMRPHTDDPSRYPGQVGRFSANG